MTARSDTIEIYKRHAVKPYYGPMPPHQLEGKSVAEWVREARAGWPKVPTPKDPLKAALKLAEKYDDISFQEA